MAKVIAEKNVQLAEQAVEKQVEIKHTRTMKDASGKDVEVVDFVESKKLDEAISDAESRKASLEAQLAEVEAELAEYIAIRDAE